MTDAGLLALSHDELIALILAQHAQIEAQAQQISVLTARVAELEAKLASPPKTPDNSSLPPSKGQKANLPDPAEKPPRPSRPGVARALSAHPDKIIEAMLNACPHCARALGPTDQPEIHAYDHVELPPIRPFVTRINRHSGVCPCCRKHVAAPAPEGLEPGSPFGPGVCALILHLHITQAIGFERLARLMGEVFSLHRSARARSPTSWPAHRRRCWPPPPRWPPRCAPPRGGLWMKPRRGSAARHGGRVPLEFDGDLSRHCRHPGGLGGDHVPGKVRNRKCGWPTARRSTRAWRGATDVPGASVARREICHRGR